MVVQFRPIGTLDINTDPSVLPGLIEGKKEFSGAMRRCTNLVLTSLGVAKTRDGSTKINSSAVAQTDAHLLIEMADDRYLFAGTVIYRDESSIATGLTSATWRGIQYNSWNDTTNNIFALNGTDIKRIDGSNVNEWGIVAPATAPTLGTTGTGLTGDYNAKYTYIRKVGSTVVHESNPSDAAGSAQTLSNENLTVDVTASSDSQVDNIRIYRTLTGGSSYFYDQEVANTTATITSSQADSALGTELETNNDRPPLGSVVVGPSFDGYIFILKDNLLYFSKRIQPESWPSTNYIEVGSRQYPLKAAIFYNNVLFVMNQDEVYLVQGSGSDSFFPFPVKTLTGALSQETVAATKAKGIYRVGNDGIYLFNGSVDEKISEAQFDPLFRGETVGDITGINTAQVDKCFLEIFNNSLYFGYPAGSNTLPTNLLVMNIATNKVQHYDYSQTFRIITIDRTNNKLLAVDNSGFIWQLEDKTVTTDDSVAISWQIETKSFTDQLAKYFPRHAKYDVNLDTGATATSTILLDDTSHQTHTISTSRKTQKRLIATGNGDRLGARLTGTGVVSIRGIEII